MKNTITPLRLITLFGSFVIILSSCKKNQNSETQDPTPVEKSSIRPEGYHPQSTGKTVEAYYQNRLVSLLEVDNGYYLLGGDILLASKDIMLAGEGRPVQTEGTIHNNLWTGKTVYYKFYDGKKKKLGGETIFAPSKTLKDMWTTATQMWKDEGFTFTEAGANATNYILLTENASGDAFSMSIGNGGGVQQLTLDPTDHNDGHGAFKAGNLAHEIGHNLGLEHEQGRFDRDLFIKVDFTKISDDWTRQYLTKPDATPVGPFDYNSIMLYPSNDGDMTRLDGAAWQHQRTYLSAGDKQAVKYWYEKTTNTETGNYKLMPYGSPDRNLEVEYRKSDANAKIDSGVNVITDTLVANLHTTSYTWEISHVSDGYYKLVPLVKDKAGKEKTFALTLSGGNAVIISTPTTDQSKQLWRIVPGYKDGYYKIYSKSDPKRCLTEIKGSTSMKSNFNAIQIGDVKIDDGQEWKLQKLTQVN